MEDDGGDEGDEEGIQERRKTTNKDWWQTFNQDGNITGGFLMLACLGDNEVGTCENHTS